MNVTIAARVGALVVLVLGGWAASAFKPSLEEHHQAAGLDAHETHASISLLGQFRTSVSAWLWLRTDLYLHNGVEMRPMTKSEQSGGHGADHAAHGDEIGDESAVVTVVPSKERDFRGLFGDIEREVSAYKDMRGHTHNDPKQALPLFRLMTWLDPQFVTGWTVGASVIARERSKEGAAKALTYLEEGLESNPRSIAIRAQMAEVLIARMRRLSAAVRVLEEVREIAREGVHEDDHDALLQAYRWLGLSYQRLGRDAELRNAMAEGLKFFPDDLVLAQLLNPPSTILISRGN